MFFTCKASIAWPIELILLCKFLSKLNMFCRLENLFQTLYVYFSKSWKRHLEFNKLPKIMEIQSNKLLKNVKTGVFLCGNLQRNL